MYKSIELTQILIGLWAQDTSTARQLNYVQDNMMETDESQFDFQSQLQDTLSPESPTLQPNRLQVELHSIAQKYKNIIVQIQQQQERQYQQGRRHFQLHQQQFQEQQEYNQKQEQERQQTQQKI
eukprot:Ihof_evm3s830 gene=Ihof_evmTU3s830